MTNTQKLMSNYERVLKVYPSNSVKGKFYKVYKLGDKLKCTCPAGDRKDYCRHRRRYINEQKGLIQEI